MTARPLQSARKIAALYRINPGVVRAAVRRLVEGGEDVAEAGLALYLVLEAARNPPEVSEEDVVLEFAEAALAVSAPTHRSAARGTLSGS